LVPAAAVPQSRSRRAVAEVAGELERGVRADPDEALGPVI
jgi:hypothetical protein